MPDGRTNEMSEPMQRVEGKLGEPLEGYLRTAYATMTLADIVDDIARRTGYRVSQSTLFRWFDQLGIERRFPGQRPEAVA